MAPRDIGAAKWGFEVAGHPRAYLVSLSITPIGADITGH
jgi:hypothetical protein